jgi:hypothetical protein
MFMTLCLLLIFFHNFTSNFLVTWYGKKEINTVVLINSWRAVIIAFFLITCACFCKHPVRYGQTAVDRRNNDRQSSDKRRIWFVIRTIDPSYAVLKYRTCECDSWMFRRCCSNRRNYTVVLYTVEPGSSVSIVSGYGLDDRAIEVRSPAGAKDT